MDKKYRRVSFREGSIPKPTPPKTMIPGSALTENVSKTTTEVFEQTNTAATVTATQEATAATINQGVKAQEIPANPTQFKHPKIFTDVLTIYKIYYHKHEALPKIFRVTIGTEIMKELSASLRCIVLANFKRLSREDFLESAQIIKELRGSIELLKSYYLIGWEMKFFSHGFFVQLMEKIEEVSRQAASWSAWIRDQSAK